MDDKTLEKIKAIVTEDCGPTGNPRDPWREKLVDEARIEEDLEIDSLQRVELCIRLEEEFDLDLDGADGTLPDFGTFGDLVKIVDDAIAAKIKAG